MPKNVSESSEVSPLPATLVAIRTVATSADGGRRATAHNVLGKSYAYYVHSRYRAHSTSWHCFDKI
eukprot:976302-Rhodomonas_salina.2